MKEKKISNINCIFIVIVGLFVFWGCDSYYSRKKLVSELSLLYSENHEEFNKIKEYFLSDSTSKFLTFRYQDDKIEIDNGNNQIIIDSIDQIKKNTDVYEILIFMKKSKMRFIYGYGDKGWITISFEENKYPCFNFWYRSDFNPEDEIIRQEIENIKDAKTKNWIYILDKKGWYIRGVKCF